jgi:2-polyprenyl-6-methoxyphenol hydroxylase-like FAD-dependent oxidoreductase
MDRFSQTGYESRVHRLEACVCVVGAGPAGLVVAHRLLSAGASCILLERSSSEALCQRAKAGMLEHRSVQALARHGLAAPILERGTTNGLVEICVDGTRQAFDDAALTGGHGHHVYPQHLLVRAWADQLLARRVPASSRARRAAPCAWNARRWCWRRAPAASSFRPTSRATTTRIRFAG